MIIDLWIYFVFSDFNGIKMSCFLLPYKYFKMSKQSLTCYENKKMRDTENFLNN